ncbi:helix-turn-helix domain-containing protein [Paenibacillus roseipurpureus]|uniref:Helix-turn-helix domain-containing protein n=1 Tax=Paenibacillus roseopurpureus TaxID=2918901 RepID=A0AA96LRP2_9BACL|nr:helix-turn-helix domain-containing protein [Paenibacillus sp. MBLB1832]WNR45974.1 helix-turn-helix domain-containing protein [Paenibacillus sp. MBLB1832]
MFISILLLSSLPVAIMGIVSASYATKIIGNHNNQMNAILLEKSRDEMDGVFRKFDELMLQYTYDNMSLRRFAEIDLNYKNHLEVRELVQTLTNLKSGMNHVLEVDFYNIPYGKVVSSSAGNIMTIDDFQDSELLDNIRHTPELGTWMSTRISINNRINTPAITLIRPIRDVSNRKVGAFIIYLDAVSLSNRMKTADPTNQLFIVNGDGFVVLHSETTRIGSSYKQEAFLNMLRSVRNSGDLQLRMSFEGTPSYLSINYSPYHDWFFVSSIPESAIAKEPLRMRNFILAGSLGLVLVALIVAFLTTKRLYSPLGHLAKRLRRHDPEEVSSLNEVQSITNYIEVMEENNQTLQKTIEQYSDEIRNYVLFQILLGGNSKLPLDEVGYVDQELALYLLELDQRELEEKFSTKDQYLYYFAVENIASELLGAFGFVKILMIQPGQFVIVHQLKDTSDHKVLQERGEAVLRSILQYLKLNCVISASYSASGAEGLHEAYVEARQGMRYRFALGGNRVIIFNQLDPAISIQTSTLTEYENDLIRSVEEMNAVLARDRFSALVSILREDYTMSVEEMIGFFSQLLFNLIRHVRSENGKVLTQQEIKSLIAELAKQRSLQQFEDFFNRQLFDKLQTEPNKGSQSDIQLIGKVTAYIQSHYDQDISLQGCAEMAGVNPFHLSRLFKKVTGINFVDYVIDYRIQIAKELLADPKLLVQDIAEMLRYANVKGFIRVFKKVTGRTPGSYRRDPGGEDREDSEE